MSGPSSRSPSHTCSVCGESYEGEGPIGHVFERVYRDPHGNKREDRRLFHAGNAPRRPRLWDRMERPCGCVRIWDYTSTHGTWRTQDRCEKHHREYIALLRKANA